MPRRIYNEYDEEIEMMEMQRRGGGQGGSRGGQGGRGGRSGGQGGNRGGQGGRGGRGAQNAYGAYGSYGPYYDYEDDWDEDEDELEMYGPYNEMEMRRGVPGSGRGRGRGRGRRRDSRGRFTSMMEEEGYYPNGPYMGGKNKERQIGFARGGSMGHEDFDEEELMYMLEDIPDELDEMEGEQWMEKISNEDGTKGAHWNREQIGKLYKEHKIREKTDGKITEDEFYYTMNMLYSDYCKVFKENNINSIKVYVELAIAWLMDKDAAENKLARYFYCVTDN